MRVRVRVATAAGSLSERARPGSATDDTCLRHGWARDGGRWLPAAISWSGPVFANVPQRGDGSRFLKDGEVGSAEPCRAAGVFRCRDLSVSILLAFPQWPVQEPTSTLACYEGAVCTWGWALWARQEIALMRTQPVLFFG